MRSRNTSRLVACAMCLAACGDNLAGDDGTGGTGSGSGSGGDPDPRVVLESLDRSAITSAGDTSMFGRATLAWTTDVAFAYDVRVGSDCTAGLRLAGAGSSGSAAAGVSVSSIIEGGDPALFEGSNTIRICDGDTSRLDVAITRDDTPPVVADVQLAQGATRISDPSTTVAVDATGDPAHLLISGDLPVSSWRPFEPGLPVVLETRGLGPTGVVVSDLSGDDDRVNAMAIRPDGRIVAAGVRGDPDRFQLVQYNPDGTRDTTFGNDGAVLGLAVGVGRVEAVAIDEDGYVVAAGSVDTATGRDFAVARFDLDGNLDAAFGVGGVVTLADDGESAWAVATDAQGRVVLAGTTSGVETIRLVRFDASGALDPTFGVAGKVTSALGAGASPRSAAYALRLQPDGKLVVGGYVWDGFAIDPDAAIVRYHEDGTLDTTFGGGDGIVRKFITNTTQGNFVVSLAPAPDGGFAAVTSVALLRIFADGTFDPSLGGAVFLPGALEASDVDVDPDGRIVVGGRYFAIGNLLFGVASYLSDGTPDVAFGGGLVTRDAAQERVGGIAFDAAGRVVVAGTQLGAQLGAQLDATLFRYNWDGSLHVDDLGPRRVCVRLRDALGNTSAPACDTVEVGPAF